MPDWIPPSRCRGRTIPAPVVVLPLLLLAVAAGLPGSVAARSFGRNKVQYDTFDWRVLVTPHLEVHFYPEEEEIAWRAAEYGEEACARLCRELGHTLGKKIPVVVFGSHYHFRQNNVVPSLVGEGTGGFTEIFRTRVVLPYSGSESEFRHVIHHELVHAFVFDMLYGGPVRGLFVLQNAFYIPLWFMEGIAEYLSNRWDSESEMMIRDAAVAATLPPFDRIHGGYFVYKSGWSAVAYLVDRHGKQVLPEILESLPVTRDLRVSIRDVTGEDLEALAADWLADVRRRTWPTIAHLGGPEDVGRLVTSHGPEEGVLNANPTLSPSGERVVFLSNRSGTPDLYLMDLEEPASPRALVRGSRGGEFESLHPLRSSVGWSPDGRYIVAAAQKGARDVLYVLEAGTGRTVAELAPPLDALERPDWSPVNARIVFTGMVRGQVDLWAVDADGTNLERLTDDLARENAPRWSPDGRRIVFSSDRSDSTGKDLWTLDVDSGEARPLRVAPGDQWDPCWSADGKEIFHVSDEHGTRDLMICSAAGGMARRLTALVGGADSPSAARAGDRLVFTAFHDGGWDLVLVEDADTLRAAAAPPVPIPAVPWGGGAGEGDGGADVVPEAGDEGAGDGEDSGDEPRVTDYRLRLHPEWIAGALRYDGFGLSAVIRTTVTDILGNHRFDLGASLVRSLRDSDAILTYSYLPHRLDWSLSFFHVRDFLFEDRTTLGQPIGEEGERAFFSERQWGALGSVTYPFHTFRRMGLELTFLELERVRFTTESRGFGETPQEAGRSRSRLLLPRIHHTFDNTLWGWTGPIQGSRSVVSLQQAIPLGGDRVSFGTALADARVYHRFSGEYVLAFRAMAASSYGPDPQRFRLGGPHTVRGYPLRELDGRNLALLSLEFRYPFLEYVRFGWPLRSTFGGVRGDLFLDVGSAFDAPRSFRLARRSPVGGRGLEDLKVGFGVGVRARVAFLPVRLDAGWPTDLARVGPPVWHFTIGPEF